MQISYRARQIAFLIFLAGSLILAGCGQQKTQAGPPQKNTPEVAIMVVQPQKMTMTTELSGRTSAYLVAEVRPQVNGIIQKRLFTEGADVKEGQALFQIDPAPFKAALDNANAALSRSEANLQAIKSKTERLRELLVEKAVSQQDYDDAAAVLKHTEADIQYWKAMVESARINLKYTSVTAPISGRIGRSNVTQGALVTAHQPVPLSTVQKLDPMYVDVPQSTTDVLRLRNRLEKRNLDHNRLLNANVRLILEDNTHYPLEGALQFRDVSVDPTTGSVILRIVFPNSKGILLPGMFVRAIVEEGVNKQAILIPQQSVSRNPKGDAFALIVDKMGNVQQRMLSLDRAIGDKWLVVSGVTPGDRVIVEGIQMVKPGDSVRAVPFAVNEKRQPESKTTVPAGAQNHGGK
jgi:membrane fusion protein (multidrug efflux system)